MTNRDWTLLLILSVLWGGSFVFQEVALNGLSPLWIVWLRVAIAALCLVPVVLIKRPAMPARGLLPLFLLLGLLNNALPFWCLVEAQTQITAGTSAIVNATTPVFSLLLGWLWLKDEQLTVRHWLGIALAFLAIIVLMLPADALATPPPVGAVLTALGAPISYACAGRVARHLLGRGIAPLMLAQGQLICSALIVGLVLPFAAAPAALPGLEVACAMLGLAVLSTSLAYLIFFRIIATAGASNAMLVTMMVPVTATILSAIWIGDTLTLTQALAMLGVLAGLALVDGRLLALLRWLQGRIGRKGQA